MKYSWTRRLGCGILAALMLTAMTFSASAASLQEVRVPESNILLAPTLISRVNSAEELESLVTDHAPAVAVLKVDSEGNTPAGALSQAVEKLGSTVIPAFQVENLEEANALNAWLADNNVNEGFVMSPYSELIQTVKEKKVRLRGILDRTQITAGSLDDAALLEIRQIVNSCNSKIVLLPDSLALKDTVTALQKWLLTVWIDAGEGTPDIVSGARILTSGCNGVLSSARTEFEDWMTGLFPENTMTRTPFVTGHRGIPDQAPENTIESAKLAVEKGADIVELDIYVTKDGELVVIHDETLDRTTNGTGKVENLTLEQIRQYTANRSYQNPSAYPEVKVPTFREYLEAFKGTDTHLFVELKSEQTNLVALFVEQVQEYGMEGQISVISFFPSQIKRVNEQLPGMSCGLLAFGQLDQAEANPGSTLLKIMNTTERYGTTYNPSFAGLNQSFVKYMADRGMTVWPWTYTDQDSFNQYFLYNVGALTTNDVSYAQFLPRRLEAQVSDGLTLGGSVPWTVNAVQYGGDKPDVTADAKIVVLSGDGKIAAGEDGTLQGIQQGEVTFLVTYTYTGTNNMTYSLATQPITVKVEAAPGLLSGVDNTLLLVIVIAAVVLVAVVILVVVIKRRKKA